MNAETKIALAVALAAVLALVVREVQRHYQREDEWLARVTHGNVRWREGYDKGRADAAGMTVTVAPTSVPGEPDNRWEWVVDEAATPHVAGALPRVRVYGEGECATRRKALRKAITVAAEAKADRALRQQATSGGAVTVIKLGEHPMSAESQYDTEEVWVFGRPQ